MPIPKEMFEDPRAFLRSTHRARISGHQEDLPPREARTQLAHDGGLRVCQQPGVHMLRKKKVHPLRRYAAETCQWEMQHQFHRSTGLLSW